MKCVICKKELGSRPNNLLIQHKAEGVSVQAICGMTDCWVTVGHRMALGRR